MTDTEINIAVAEACGWKRWKQNNKVWLRQAPNENMLSYWKSVGIAETTDEITEKTTHPNYCHDLNAMHEAENTLPISGGQDRDCYKRNLQRIVPAGLDSDDDLFLLLNATARQRAEAFLRTIGKWKQ